MEIINRKDITEAYSREILDVVTHTEHPILRDQNGKLHWQENKDVVKWVDKIGLNEVMMLFESLGLDKNSELVRKLYRDMGYSLFGYWEVFYCELNNDIADEYEPEFNIRTEN